MLLDMEHPTAGGMLSICLPKQASEIRLGARSRVKFLLRQSGARCAVKLVLCTSEVRLVIPSTTKGGPPPLTIDKGRWHGKAVTDE